MNKELENHLSSVVAYRRAPAVSPPHSLLGFECPKGMLGLLGFSDGFITRDRVFRIFGITPDDQLPSLEEWNLSEWKLAYGHLADGLLFVAEDLFGDQYGYSFRGGKRQFIKFYCEGGEVEVIKGGMCWFIDALVSPAESGAVDGELIAAAAASGLRPSANEHLGFKVPLIVGGRRDVTNLAVESVPLHLGVLSQLSRTNAILPDGAPIARFSSDSPV